MIIRTLIGPRGGERAIVDCQCCGGVFDVPAWKFKTGRGRFCSPSCRSKVSGVENYKNLSSGQKQKLATLSSIRLRQTRRKQASDQTLQPHWKGDKVGYSGLHRWLKDRFGIPKYCEMCGTKDQNKKYEWANISGQYRRDRSDFIRLCTLCHRRWDRKRREEKKHDNA